MAPAKLPVNPPPPSTQHHSGLARQLSDRSQLTEDQLRSCDDIITLVGDANRNGDKPTREARKGLWDAVFANGWNTNCPNIHPGPIRGRRAVESMIQIGTWSANLPVTPSKRKAGENSPGPHRLAGAPAYLKPNLQWSNFGINWITCDAKSSAAKDEYVRLFPGWTMAQAHSECITHFDAHESERVGTYNNRLAVCWARSRLLVSLRVSAESSTQGTEVPRGERPVGTLNEIPVNARELVKLETCEQRILAMARLVTDAGMIARRAQAPKLETLRSRD